MRITLIVNPFASSVTPRVRVRIGQLLGADHQLTTIETTKGGHAIRLAHGAGKAGADLVIALGGDGTINEVANGLLDTTVAAAPLPGGSTNVFARSLGFPSDPVSATSTLLEALDAGAMERVGVGLANGRAFLFHAGIGYDAAVVERVERRGALKRVLGHPLFVATAVDTLARRVDRRRPWMSVTSDDGRRTADAKLVIALNTAPYTYLGSRPVHLAPEAGLDQPLSLVTSSSLSLLRLVPAGLRGLAERPVEQTPGVTHWSRVQGATVRGYRPFPHQLDGEFIGRTSRLRLEHRPSCLTLVMPRRTTAAVARPAREQPGLQPGRW